MSDVKKRIQRSHWGVNIIEPRKLMARKQGKTYRFLHQGTCKPDYKLHPDLKLILCWIWPCAHESGDSKGQKSVFFIQGNVVFNLSVTLSIPTSNNQMMKTKLSTFAGKRKTVNQNDGSKEAQNFFFLARKSILGGIISFDLKSFEICIHLWKVKTLFLGNLLKKNFNIE